MCMDRNVGYVGAVKRDPRYAFICLGINSSSCCPGWELKWPAGCSSSSFSLCESSGKGSTSLTTALCSQKFMLRMTEVLHYLPGLGTAQLAVGRLQVRELSSDGVLSWSHHPLEILLDAVPKRGRDVFCQDALHNAGVKHVFQWELLEK